MLISIDPIEPTGHKIGSIPPPLEIGSHTDEGKIPMGLGRVRRLQGLKNLSPSTGGSPSLADQKPELIRKGRGW